MENLYVPYSVSLFMTMVVFVLLPHLKFSAASTYSRPQKFYVNCGSGSNVTYTGRTFVGDMASGGNFVSFTKNVTEASNQSGSSITPEIYRTVRIFKRPSSYTFQLDAVGLHLVRLHFSASSELLTARFNVSATSGSSVHFKSFSVQNFSETVRVEEFLLMINSPQLEIGFVPDVSSVALDNAIEVFSAHYNLTILSNPDKNLHTIYRLNVGGPKITPEDDILGRTWSLDEAFLHKKDIARNIDSIQKLNYDSGSTEFIAPDLVYQTAKTISSSETFRTLINVTWSFKVKSNLRHFIRVHFCDIKSEILNINSDFYLYVNGHWRIDVKPSEQSTLMTPFYIDVVNVSDGSGLLNVSIGTKDTGKDAGFLNGIEMMEFSEESSPSLILKDGSSSRVYIIAGSAVVGLFLVLGLGFILFLKRRRSKKKKADAEITVWSPLPLYMGGGSSDNRPFYSDNNSPLGNLQLGLKIPFTDILRATNNFNEQWLIGKGGFGDVYKAILPDGSKVAIKRGKSGSGQGKLEFQTEIQVLSRICHRHLVSLTGYCQENSEMILVYEFIEKGTLQEHLYGSNLPSLTWTQRLEICIEAARGLHYLHSGSEEAIIHRDVKSTNILLDENTIAKVADFGISKLVVCNQEPINISTNIKGTYGYLDPEYVQTRILTQKSDVYSFGVVLLEVLCARRALARDLPQEKVNLAEWAMSCKSKGIIDEIVDPRLVGQIKPFVLRKFMEAAEKCLKDYGDARPSMADVSWELEYILRLQMMTINDDSAATISSCGGDGSLMIPRLMVSDSFNCNSIVQEDQVKNKYGSTDSSKTRTFSQVGQEP